MSSMKLRHHMRRRMRWDSCSLNVPSKEFVSEFSSRVEGVERVNEC